MASCIAVIGNDQEKLLERLWPGPVSVLLKAKQDIDPLLAPGGKVALRISPNLLANSLVEMVGPITSTSANRSGEPPARTAHEVAGMGLAIEAIFDGGETRGGKPSTLIDLTIWPPVCLREGAVTFQEILAKCS
jgi:L-threonylcarbamoyladenylate synthase